jgi:hypothetical protein
MGAMFGFEAMTEQGWDASACGEQNASNYFATEAEAMAELPNLAAVLGCPVAELRVVAVEVEASHNAEAV